MDKGTGLYSFNADGCQVTIFAHHVSYYLRTGEIPEGRSIRLCAPSTDGRSARSAAVCVNPKHFAMKGTPRRSREDQGGNGRRPPSYSSTLPLFSQGDLCHIRAAAERTARARDVADAMNHQLTPDETFLITLAENIVAALPEDVMRNYRIALPPADDETADVPVPAPLATSTHA